MAIGNLARLMKASDCTICKSNRSRVLVSGLTISRLGQFNVIQCQDCSASRLDPMPSEGALRALYSEGDFFLASGDRHGYSDYLKDENAKYKSARSILGKIEKYKGRGRLLEIGCAVGFFLKIAREGGWDAQGVEVSQWASSYGRDQLGLNIFTGTLEEARFPDESFDVIAAIDVIEHLLDPVTFLEEVGRVLRQRGVFVFEVPNAPLELRRIRAMENPYYAQPHIHFFPPRTIKALLGKTGFRIREVEYIDSKAALADLGMLKTPAAATYVSKLRDRIYKGQRLKRLLKPIRNLIGLGHDVEILCQKV